MIAVATRPPRCREPSFPAGPLTPKERKAYDAIPEEINHVRHPDYCLAAAEQNLFGPDARNIPVPRWRPYFGGDQPGSARPAECPRLSRRDEAELFHRYNYARYRLARAMGPQRRRFSNRRARQALLWHRRVLETRAALVSANMALVPAMARRFRSNGIELEELVSEGNMALMRAVDKFDVGRGYKFSTYACQAVLKAFSRLARQAGRYRQRFPTEYVPGMEKSDETERRHEAQRDLAIEDLQSVLAHNLADLTEVERTIVGTRFAVYGHGEAHTLEVVASRVGLSKERVRGIQIHALAKLRAAMEDQAVAERRPALASGG